MCVVFAESEIVGLLAAGVLPEEDIATGVKPRSPRGLPP